MSPIDGGTLDNASQKVIPTNPREMNTKPTSHVPLVSNDFLEPVSKNGTVNSCQLTGIIELAAIDSGGSKEMPQKTVWDLLRKDWKLLLESGFGPDDTVGSITVVAEVEGREVHRNQGVRLDRHRELAETIRGLRDRFPDPLEVRFTAEHNGRHEARGKFTQAKARAI